MRYFGIELYSNFMAKSLKLVEVFLLFLFSACDPLSSLSSINLDDFSHSSSLRSEIDLLGKPFKIYPVVLTDNQEFVAFQCAAIPFCAYNNISHHIL